MRDEDEPQFVWFRDRNWCGSWTRVMGFKDGKFLRCRIWVQSRDQEFGVVWVRDLSVWRIVSEKFKCFLAFWTERETFRFLFESLDGSESQDLKIGSRREPRFWGPSSMRFWSEIEVIVSSSVTNSHCTSRAEPESKCDEMI